MLRRFSGFSSIIEELQVQQEDPPRLSLTVLAYGMNPKISVQTGPSSKAHVQPRISSRPAKLFPPGKYVAVAAQVVYYGIVSRLPMVAKVVVVDYRGNIILDTLVRPTQPISDYRTAETGLQPVTFANAPTFIDVQQQVAALIRNKIIVGYALWQFLSVLGLAHPAIDTRDAALFIPFRRSLRSKASMTLPLMTLVNWLMGREIGLQGESPLEHARAALDLFRSCEHYWEELVDSGAWPCALPPISYANCFT